MIRRILVVVAGTPCDEKSCQVACLLAKRLGAAAEALAIEIDPSDLMFRLGEGVSASAIDSIVEAAEKSSSQAAARAKATFEKAAAAAGLELVHVAPAEPKAAAHFYTMQGPAVDVLTQEAALADLVVFGEPGDTAPIDYAAKIQHTLMALRRPVLIARGKVGASFGDNILIPFNGTLEAANALTHTSSLLAAARTVEILHLKENEGDAGVGADALRYIQQHGGVASVREMEPSANGIGQDIVEQVVAAGSDLVVMGGYGRSRLREFVMGGATRHLMNHAPVPVLLAH
jgi:nucleotide-binding universal stress UspA family protein